MDKQNAKNESGMVSLYNQEMKELQEHQKQIEEMAKILDEDCGDCYKCNYYDNEDSGGIECIFWLYAERLYNAGYRKIPENAVVLTREEYDEIKQYQSYIPELKKAFDKICKETAEKIADWLDNEKGYCGLGYLVKQKFCAEEK